MPNVVATPTQAQVCGKTRVLCVYGSESGNAKRGLDRLLKKWKAAASNFEIIDVLTGNELAKKLGGGGNASAKNLEYVAQRADVLLVCTSSYGSGDPPSNMRELTKVLSHEASMKSDALTGVQHAVLGFGSSTYTTFQNIPRLTDKFLGECGSRRMAKRAEIDEHDRVAPLAQEPSLSINACPSDTATVRCCSQLNLAMRSSTDAGMRTCSACSRRFHQRALHQCANGPLRRAKSQCLKTTRRTTSVEYPWCTRSVRSSSPLSQPRCGTSITARCRPQHEPAGATRGCPQQRSERGMKK